MNTDKCKECEELKELEEIEMKWAQMSLAERANEYCKMVTEYYKTPRTIPVRRTTA